MSKKGEKPGPTAQAPKPKKNSINPLTDSSFLIFAFIALIAGFLCYIKGEKVLYNGLDASLEMFLYVTPKMIGAFLLAGFVEVLMPKDMITKWIGKKSGIKGILIATVAGGLTPGGPMVSFPLIAALYKLGADFGPLVAYLTSWELMGIQRILVWEIPFMGMQFVSLRIAVSAILPILAGFTANKLVSYFALTSKTKED